MNIFAIVFVAFLCLLAICFLNNNLSLKNSSPSTEGLATVNNPLISPSGMYQLNVYEEIKEGVINNRFSIYRITNEKIESTPVFISDDYYRTRDALFFLWDIDDRVWVYSGDVGTFFWEYVAEGDWEKHKYKDSNISPPDLLVKLRPSVFN